jgi:transcriptional regulator with XRE-family HTH domain
MPRSLRVQPTQLNRVKLALQRNGYSSQRALAEEVGLSLATVSNFLTGKPLDYSTFAELSRQLGLEWKDIANLDFAIEPPTKPQSLEFFDTEPDNSPPYPNGAVPLGSPFYLERQPVEAQIKQEIRKRGTLIRIKAPREMGKTSLLLRSLEFAKTQNYHTVSLNLDQVDRAILNDLNQFLRWLCANIARQLHLKPDLEEYWNQDLGSKISCTAYFERFAAVPTFNVRASVGIRAGYCSGVEITKSLFCRCILVLNILFKFFNWCAAT